MLRASLAREVVCATTRPPDGQRMVAIDIRQGDCRELLASIPDASIDSVVCDPPYELGFMGKSWDASGTAYDPKVWAQCLRVLKPGGHLLAFGGTRTYHRVACAIEDVGFEIRDSITWLYGCLSEDTEILTEHGWKLGTSVGEGECVAQWTPRTEAVSLAPVERKFLAPWNGPMRALRNSDGDQLVTPNHRVWHRTWSRKMHKGVRSSTYQEGWDVVQAADLTRYAPTSPASVGVPRGRRYWRRRLRRPAGVGVDRRRIRPCPEYGCSYLPVLFG